MKIKKIKRWTLPIFIGIAIMFFMQNVYAADCAVGYTATSGATLTHTTWNSEFGNVMSCMNNRLEEAGGNMTGNLNVYSGYDVNWYSDAGTSLAATVDGATGNATFNNVTLGATDKLYLDGGSDTYIYEQGGNTVQIVAGGTSALTAGASSVIVDSGRDFVMTGGKKIYLDGGSDTYLYLQGDNTVQFVTGNNAALTVGGGGTVVENGPLWVPNLNTSSGTSLAVDANGQIIKGSSSRRYKENITNLEVDSSLIYQLRPVSYEDINDHKEIKTRNVGLIAEEVDGIIPNLVYHNNDGSPESIHYERIGVLLIAEIKKLNERVRILESQLAAE
jgi:hypothetical protein